MLRRLGILFAALAACFAGQVHADATLVYETTVGSGDKVQHTISISGRWLRLDSDAKDSNKYTLMDTGRQLKFDVDDKTKSYTVTRVGRLYWPAFTTPKFKATRTQRKLGEVRCRKVLEILDGQPVVEHCMTASGPLNLNAREQITLSRLFMSARRIGMGWTGASTEDERQVSVQSKRIDGDNAQELKSVSHEVIPSEKLRIPPQYKRVGPDKPDYDPAHPKKKTAKATQEQAKATQAPESEPEHPEHSEDEK